MACMRAIIDIAEYGIALAYDESPQRPRPVTHRKTAAARIVEVCDSSNHAFQIDRLMRPHAGAAANMRFRTKTASNIRPGRLNDAVYKKNFG